MAKLYTVDYKESDVQPKDGEKFTLEEAQAIVGGYVELVRLDNDNILLCDEEGFIKRKRINIKATLQAKEMGWKGECLCGSVLFLKDKEF